jgi:hypothetical protein
MRFEKYIIEKDEIISKIAAEAGAAGAKLMSLRKPLESIFPKKDVDFVLSPVAHFRIKYKGKTIILVNKKYADDAEEIVNDIAIGYEGKI